MVVFKESLEECTMLGIMKVVYHFPVYYYLWNKDEQVYSYEYFEDLPKQFKVISITLSYKNKIISVYLEEI